LQVLSLDEILNGMNSNKMNIKQEWINMFNDYGGTNLQNK